MKTKKYRVCVVIYIFIIITGVLKVNSEQLKTSGVKIKTSVFSEVEKTLYMPELYEDGLYNEVELSKEENRKIYMYMHIRPVDLRISDGFYTLYINNSIIEKIKTIIHKNDMLTKPLNKS